MKTELKRLDEQVDKNRRSRRVVHAAPMLNALYSGNIKVEQNWLPDLTINYNFRGVAVRSLRHLPSGIAKTAPGSATDPMYPTLPREQRTARCNSGDAAKTPKTAEDASPADALARSTAWSFSATATSTTPT